MRLTLASAPGVLGLIGRDFVAGTLKKAEQALFLFVHVEFFQLDHYVGQHLADFAHILSTDVVERCFRKIGDFFLRAGTVLENRWNC